MGYRDERLWKILEEKAAQEDKELRTERQIAPEYLSAVKTVCDYGVQRAKAIRDTFPLYTLHDEVHICNVLNLMAELLGDEIERLNRDEAAMLPVILKHGIPPFLDPERLEESFHELYQRRDRIYRDIADITIDLGPYRDKKETAQDLVSALEEKGYVQHIR